jgi:hypothetical protein
MQITLPQFTFYYILYRKLEGGLKNNLIPKKASKLIYKFTAGKFKKSFLFSLKTGLITFFVLLALLIGFDNLSNAVNGHKFVINKVDVLTSFLGFLLIFSAKFLEKFYGKS